MAYREGDRLASHTVANGNNTDHIQQVALVDSTGAAVGASAPLPAGTDRSGSITTGGVAQGVAVANAARKGFTFQNTSDTEMRVTESGTTATATTGYQVAPGGRFTAYTNKLITVFCATTGKTFAATEW